MDNERKTNRAKQSKQKTNKARLYHHIHQLEFGMYPQSMPTEWTHVRTVRAWQSVRLDL